MFSLILDHAMLMKGVNVMYSLFENEHLLKKAFNAECLDQKDEW